MTNEPNVTLNLTVNEVNLVLAGLGELPARMSLPVINKVTDQAQRQVGQSAETLPKSN